jgi:L-threonylcarbamoyladenylate synthase
VSPTTAEHVRSEFGDDLLVLDGGACEVGIESAIVDCTRDVPVLLRPGVLTRAGLAAACGERLWLPGELTGAHEPAPRASGTLESHYAPRATVRLMDASSLRSALRVLGTDAPRIGVYARTAVHSGSSQVTVRRLPDDAATAARELFAVLRELDDAGVQLIWVEAPPADPAWDGVRDRLQRAAVR